MTQHETPSAHPNGHGHGHRHHMHAHGKGCGHVAIRHGDHVDYLHDGHLHHVQGIEHVVEHSLEVSARNPDVCKRLSCVHAAEHEGRSEQAPHGDHVDFIVEGRLHHVHDGHCDDHGEVILA